MAAMAFLAADIGGTHGRVALMRASHNGPRGVETLAYRVFTCADFSTLSELLQAFVDAAQKGDMAGLEGLFAEDVVSYSDGGGIVRAARVPVSGRERVAKFIAAASHFWKGVTLAWVETNGQAALLVSRDGVPVALTTIDASTQGIDQIMWIMRPSKLAAISMARLRIG